MCLFTFYRKEDDSIGGSRVCVVSENSMVKVGDMAEAQRIGDCNW